MNKIDWTKIKTLEEVLMVLSLLEVNISDEAIEEMPHLKEYLKNG